MNATLARLRPLLWLLALVAAAVALRAPFLQRELWNLDEAVTFTAAQQIREGAVLYRDAADHRSPLVPYLKAAVFAVAGDWNVHAVHLTLAAALGLVAFLLYDLARRLGHARVGAWSAVSFTLLAIVLPGTYDSLAAHTEWFVVFFSTLGFWFFARAIAPRSAGVPPASVHASAFLSGLPIGLAFGASALCKQPGLLDFFVLCVLLAFLAIAAPAARSRAFRLWLGACLGVAACFAAAFAYFAAHGALHDFLYYGWTYNTQIYVPEIPFLSRLKAIRVPFMLAWEYLPPALVLALAGAASMLRSLARFRFSLLPWLILGWTASGLLSCALSGREFDHYVIQSVPGLSLACGWMLARLAVAVRPSEPRRWRRALAGLLFAVLATWTAIDAVRFAKKVAPHEAPENARVAALLQRFSSPAERLLVWGYYPEAHLLARRLPATRFLYSNFLTGMIPWTNLSPEIDTHYAVVPGAWDAFWHDYTAHPPPLVAEAVMRGYLKYPLLGQPRLRDDIIDHFARMQPGEGEALSLNLYRRLDPLPATLPAATIDPSLELHPARVHSNPDVVLVIVRRAPGDGTGGAVTLRLAGHPYRRLVLPDAAPVEIGFLVRVADLAAAGANQIDAVLERAGHAIASPPLDVVRRLALEVHPAEPAPVLAYSVQRLASSTATDPAAWHPEPRGESLGWRTASAFALTFARPAAMEILELEWQPPAGTTAAPELIFTPVTGDPIPLSPASTATDHATRRLAVHLPTGQSGTLTLRWSPPAAATSSAAAWLGALRGYAPGPGLSFRDRTIPPALSEHVAGAPLTRQPDGSWLAPAPLRLLYPRLDRMNALVVDYGFIDRAYTDPAARPGEIVLEVNFVHDDGRRENLLSDLIRPRLDPQTRGKHTRRVGLPASSPGEIEIKCAAVSGHESPDNQLYLFPPRIQGPGPDIVLAVDRILTPTESETANGEPITTCVDGRWIAHAPGHVVYLCPPDLRTVDFGFGLDERAYWGDNGAMRSNGIDVVVEFRDEHETSTELYRRRLDPRLVVADRGVQHGHLELSGRPGKLVFHLAPGPNNDASYDWSYWTDFTGTARLAP